MIPASPRDGLSHGMSQTPSKSLFTIGVQYVKLRLLPGER